MIHSIAVYFDGTVGPTDPGPAGAAAFAVFKNDGLIHKTSVFLDPVGAPFKAVGAEYQAVVYALQWLLDNELYRAHVRLYGDTLDTIRQLSGIWEIPPSLAQQYAAAASLERKFRDISFTCVTFKANTLAVDLAEKELIKNGVQPVRLTLKAAKTMESL